LLKRSLLFFQAAAVAGCLKKAQSKFANLLDKIAAAFTKTSLGPFRRMAPFKVGTFLRPLTGAEREMFEDPECE